MQLSTLQLDSLPSAVKGDYKAFLTTNGEGQSLDTIHLNRYSKSVRQITS